MLVRITNMRGVDLRLFDFDFDLTWAAFFMNPRGGIYGRFGGREDENADRHLTLDALKHAMREALASFAKYADRAAESVPAPFTTVDEYPAAKRVKAEGCIHCHQVTEFRRDYLRAQKQWTREQIWTYPPPRNIGVALEESSGTKVATVAASSRAALAGIRPGDILRKIGGRPVATFADVQYALHRSPNSGPVAIEWERDGSAMKATMDLPAGWRESDISWRATMWGLSPPASVYGADLTAEEKRALGLAESQLAFRMGDFVPKPAQTAGIHARDIIVGVDGKKLEMNMLQFNVWVRLNFQVGDRIVYNLIRNGQHLEIPMVLADKDSF